MDSPHPRSVASIAGHPVHPMLVPFPIAFFTLALVMDVAYWQSSNLNWKHFAEWLLLAGLVAGALAAVVGAIDFFSRREIRSRAPAWPHAIGNVLVMILSVFEQLGSCARWLDGRRPDWPCALCCDRLAAAHHRLARWFNGLSPRCGSEAC